MGKRTCLFIQVLALVASTGLLAGGRAEANGDGRPSLMAGPACGASWQSVSSPSLWPAGPSFNGVAAAGPDDVWLVGSVEPAHTRKALTEHWDGTEWRQVATPELYPEADLAAVVA